MATMWESTLRAVGCMSRIVVMVMIMMSVGRVIT